jgi:hypothetical protein
MWAHGYFFPGLFAEARSIWMCTGTCGCDEYATLPQVHNW